MAMIFRKLFLTKAYLDDITSIFKSRVRISTRASDGGEPDKLELDQVAADIIGVSSSDLEDWIGDDSSLSNLTDAAVYVALKLMISRYTNSSWNYEDGSGLNYLAPVNIIAQEVSNNIGDSDKITQVLDDSKNNLTQKFNPYQVLGYSPYSIFDGIKKLFNGKFTLGGHNSKFVDLLSLALVTDYSASYAGLDEDGSPCYDLNLYPSSVNRLIDPVAMTYAVQYVYIDGFNHLNQDQHVNVELKEFEDTHPLMCAFASYSIRVQTTKTENIIDPILRADWQVYRIKDFYSRYPSSIELLIKNVSYADMVAILSGRQSDATDEASAISPYASAYNLANIWSAFLNLCKSTDQSIWIAYDCGVAESHLYSPMVGRNGFNYGFFNATSLPHLLPEISVSSFKSLRDNRINEKILNLILSNVKIASSASASGINVCDCDGEWWPSSSSYYDKTPSVIYLGPKTEFTVDTSANTAKKVLQNRISSLTIFDKRSYFVYSVQDQVVKVIRRPNSSQKFMSVFLGLADNYKSGRIANPQNIDTAVKSNANKTFFDKPSQLWQKSLRNANIEILVRQLIRSVDSSTKVSVDPTDKFDNTTSVWYDKVIAYVRNEVGFEDCNWINSSLGPSVTGNHLISINKHAVTTGCLGGGLHS